MSNFHTRAHLARSIYEGVAFSHRYHLEKLLLSKTTSTRSIRLAGGAAKSAVWTQMFADVMNLTVEAVDVNETGALGCAVICAVACGAYATLAEAADAMCGMSPAVKPIPRNVSIYEQKYALYKKAIEALDPYWDELRSMRETLEIS